MRIVFDTSVLVASLIETHAHHGRSVPWLERAKANKFDMFISSHSLAELYAALTTIPGSPRISPAMARRMIQEDVEAIAKIVAFSPSDYRLVIQQLSDLGLSGGIVYDALITRAAVKVKADRLLTLNRTDFIRVWPEGEKRVIAP